MRVHLVWASLLVLNMAGCDDDEAGGDDAGAGGGGGVVAAGGAGGGGAGGDATPEELAACIGLSAGGACRVESANGAQTEGTCQEAANGLACRADMGGMGGMGGMGPPQAALDACAGSAENAVCSFEGRNGTIDGLCIETDNGLTCTPEGGGMGGMMGGMGGMMGGMGGMMGPPQAAIDACEGRMVDDACMFEGRNGTVEGTCTDGRDGLVCRGAGMGMGGMGGMMGGMGGMMGGMGGMMGGMGGMMGPPQEAIAACEGRMEGDACSFIDADGRMIDGECFMGPDALSCRPGMRPEGGMGGAGGMPPEGGMGGAGGMPPEGGMGGAGGMMMPPDAALTACDGQMAGDDCAFDAEGRQVMGACINTMDGLVCVPDMVGGAGGGAGGAGGAGGGGMMMPPPAALEACEGIDVGAECTIMTPDGRQIAGTCRNTPDGVACVPARM